MKKLKLMVANDLSLREDLVEKVLDEQALLDLITRYVQEMIDSNFELLLRTLYRLDVSEAKVKAAIDATEPGEASIAIAKLVLEREKQKVITREQFNSDNEDSDWIF